MPALQGYQTTIKKDIADLQLHGEPEYIRCVPAVPWIAAIHR